jgi:HAD superfamily hydrolase (TIGR01509 family)
MSRDAAAVAAAAAAGMFDAIFWDNDGVLMATEHLYYRANAEALAQVGVALDLPTFCAISLQRGESVLQLAGNREHAIRTWRDARYHELLADEATVMPGAAELLARLHGRLPMAIVTSCRRPHFERMHRHSGLTGYFDFILTREDYGNSKPDPEPYLTACRRAGVEPGRCLAVEDSVRGVTAAAAAGLAVAALPGTLNTAGDFGAARWRLDHLAELAPLLGI